MMKHDDSKKETKKSIKLRQTTNSVKMSDSPFFFSLFNGVASAHPREYCSEQSLILFLLSGEIQITSLYAMTTTLHGGQCVFMPKNVPVKVVTINNTSVLMMRFSYRTFMPSGREVWEDCSEKIERCTHPVLDLAPLMTTALESIVYSRVLLSSSNYQRIKAEEIHETARLCYSNHQRAWFCQSIVRPQDDFRVFVETNLDKAQNCVEMAEIANMSESSFRRLFRKIFGEPVRDWLMKQKVAQMTQLVQQGEQDYKRLMAELGFVDKTSYIRFCKQWMGGNPSEIIREISSHNTSE